MKYLFFKTNKTNILNSTQWQKDTTTIVSRVTVPVYLCDSVAVNPCCQRAPPQLFAANVHCRALQWRDEVAQILMHRTVNQGEGKGKMWQNEHRQGRRLATGLIASYFETVKWLRHQKFAFDFLKLFAWFLCAV